MTARTACVAFDTHLPPRFYAAEVCLALKFLHKDNILHRNLKLSNVMLSLDGHIKLVNFGVSKELPNSAATTKTFCGSPEFLAPEVGPISFLGYIKTLI